jgi:hypothetical protein
VIDFDALLLQKPIRLGEPNAAGQALARSDAVYLHTPSRPLAQCDTWLSYFIKKPADGVMQRGLVGFQSQDIVAALIDDLPGLWSEVPASQRIIFANGDRGMTPNPEAPSTSQRIVPVRTRRTARFSRRQHSRTA